MHVHADSLEHMVRTTVDAGVELTNVLDDGAPAVRAVLVEHEFSRAATASDDEMAEVMNRLRSVSDIIRVLPEADLAKAVDQVNSELGGCRVQPNLSAHDGEALHVHWTSNETEFGAQVAVDLLMALGQALCDHGTAQFGRCGAEGCDRVFFDTTKNRSRRFCSDPRCATRTHTAAHRARRAGNPE